MRGGGWEGPAQIFCPPFTNCILGQFGDGEGGGDPCPKCFGSLVFKKSGTSCPNWGEGGGVEVIWTKSKRAATFFREAFFKQGHWKQNESRLWTLSLFTTETCFFFKNKKIPSDRKVAPCFTLFTLGTPSTLF